MRSNGQYPGTGVTCQGRYPTLPDHCAAQRVLPAPDPSPWCIEIENRPYDTPLWERWPGDTARARTPPLRRSDRSAVLDSEGDVVATEYLLLPQQSPDSSECMREAPSTRHGRRGREVISSLRTQEGLCDRGSME